MIFLKKNILRNYIFLWSMCLIFSEVKAHEDISSYSYEVAQRFIESISIFSTPGYEMSSGIPMRISTQEGALDLVGDVKLKLYIGTCLNEKDQVLLSKLLDKKVAQRHPNCKLYKLGHTCRRNSPEIKTTCALRADKTRLCPMPKGMSEISLELKCMLPLRGSNIFFTEEKVYQ